MAKSKNSGRGFTDYTVICDGKPKLTHEDVDVCRAKRAALLAENPAQNVIIQERVVGDERDDDSVEYTEVV